jgi:hypothetical protein
VTLTPHLLLVPRTKKQSAAIPLLSLRAFVAYKKGETLFLELTSNRQADGYFEIKYIPFPHITSTFT